MTEQNVARPDGMGTTAPWETPWGTGDTGHGGDTGHTRDAGGGGVRGETGEDAAGSAPAAFGEFYQLTSARMLTRATMICGGRQDAEDIVADAYLEAFRHWDRIGRYDRRAAEKWVHTTMQRRWWKVAGRRRRREAGELQVPVRPHSSPEQTAEVTMVLAALPTLAERERIVILAHCVYGLPQKEIAAALGVKSALVAVYLFQARRKLERLMGLTRPSRRSEERLTFPGGLLADPLAVVLRDVSAWLGEAFEAEGAGLERVHRAIESALPAPGGREPR